MPDTISSAEPSDAAATKAVSEPLEPRSSEVLTVGPPAAAPWVRWLPWAAGVVAVLTAFGVFALPWLVPMQVQLVQSDSLMVGFSNQVAIVALALGAVMMSALGLVWRFGDREAFVGVRPGLIGDEERTEQIDRRLVIALMVAIGVLAGLLAFAYGRYPSSDAAYFVDRLLELVSGGRLYVDFEWAYGPLLIYPAYGLWLALHGLGLDVYGAFYLFSLAGHLLGIAMAVYLLNRMRLPKSWKHALLLLVFAFDFLIADLGLNYSSIRFLAPFVLLVWAMGLARRGDVRGVVGAAVASGMAYGVSPEMGVAASIALVVAFTMLAVRKRPLMWLAAGAAAAVGASGFLVNSRLKGSFFALFGGGAGQFPVLPGQPSFVFVATMLAFGLAVGLTSESADWWETALQSGWFAGSFVLIVAAFGRADFGHEFWNGVPAVLLLTACLWQVWPKAAVSYLSVAFAAFVFMAVAFVPISVPGLFASAVNSGAISQEQSVWLARSLGRTDKTGEDWYTGSLVPEPTPGDVDALSRAGGVLAPFFLQGRVGEQLAESRALVHSFALPGFATAPRNVDAIRRDLAAARYVLLPRTEYDAYTKLATARFARAAPEVRMAKMGSNVMQFAVLSQFPLSVRAVHPTYEPQLAFGLVLHRDWVVDRNSGGYVILRKSR